MGSSNMKKDCVSRVSPSVSSLNVVARRKKGGLLYFKVNPHHSFTTKVT
jgi:hypothetical protein